MFLALMKKKYTNNNIKIFCRKLKEQKHDWNDFQYLQKGIKKGV